MLDVPGLQAGNSNQQRGSVNDPESGDAGGKTHLPQVVLRHKMREFEAKMNASSALADPLDADGVLSRLSIEDKERVMARMQDKIRAITDEIEASFSRIRREMDAHGVFDEAANYQRAQAMCLVELQRRCRLEKLRDEAVDEILGVKKSSSGGRKMSSAFLGAGFTDGKAAASAKRMERNLSSLLRSPEHQHHAGNSRTQQRPPNDPEMRRARRTDSRGQKRAAILPKIDADTRRSATAPTGASSPSRVAAAPVSPASRRGKRGGGGEASETEQPNASEASAGAADEVWTRHPHVLHAIQTLNSGKEPIKGNASGCHGSARGTGELEVESDRRLSSAEEWQERSASYRAIAQRTASELWRRADRLRWDSTGHFGDMSTPSVFTPSADLRKRLEAQQQRLLRPYGAAGGDQDDDEREKRQRESAVDESLSMRRQRTAQEYVALQAQIIERLTKWNCQRSPNSSAARRKQRQQLHSSHGRESSGVPDTPPLMSSIEQINAVATPKSATLSRPVSTAGLLSTHEPAIDESNERPTDRSERLDLPELSGSASLPVLAATAPSPVTSPSPASLLTLGRRPCTRHRLSLLERRLLASQQPEQCANDQDGAWVLHQRGSLRPSRRGFRRESRIGAPPPVPNFATFGRHSDARMAERRYSAQTWAWYASDGVNADEHADLDEGASEEDDDEFDDALFEEGDEDEEGDEADADEGGEQLGRPRLRANKSGLSSLAVPRDGSRVLNDADSEDACSMASWSAHMSQSARSLVSVATTVMSTTSKQTTNSGSHRRRSSKRRVSGTGKGANGSGRHAALSGDALSLHSRLEAVWKALEFPSSHKLLMVEKYAELVEDSGALERALELWEACALAVLARERMKSALAEFAGRQELKDGSRLGPDEVAALAAAMKEGGDGELDGDKAAGSGRAIDAQLVNALSAERYVKWVSRLCADAAWYR